MVAIQFSEGITEVLDILKHMEKTYTDRIPQKFKDFLEENKSTTYEPHLDHSKRLNEMELKEDTKNILGVIYSNYWCDENQKKEFMLKIKNNEIAYQKELKEKYNPDDIFKKHSQEPEIERDIIQNNVSMIEYKESIIKKIVNKIKSFFKF